MVTYRQLSILLLGAPLLLGACDGVRDTLGLTRNGPDEFAVATTPPLVMPPDFTLRPPAPGSEGAQGLAASEQAKSVLLGNDAGKPVAASTASSGETALLQQAGSAAPKPAVTAANNAQQASPQAKILDTVLFSAPAPDANAPSITMKRDSDGWFSWL